MPMSFAHELKSIGGWRRVLAIFGVLLYGGSTATIPAAESRGLRVDPAASELRLDLGAGLPSVRLGRLRFVTRRAAQGDEATLMDAQVTGPGAWTLGGLAGLGQIGLETHDEPGGLAIAVDLRPLNRTAGLFRPVIELVDPGAPIDGVIGGTIKSGRGRSVARIDLGFAVVVAEFDPRDVARTMIAPNDGTLVSWRWHSKVVETAPEEPFVLHLRCEWPTPADAQASLVGKLEQRRGDLEARLAAWDSLLPAKTRALAEPVKIQSGQLAAALQLAAARSPASLAEALAAVAELRVKVEMAENAFADLLRAQQAELFAASRARLAGMRYRAGIAFDSDPAGELEGWALFRMGLFRLSVNPVWHHGRDRGARTAIVRRALQDAARYGGRAVLSVYEEKQAAGPADLTFSNEFVPLLRSGFHEYGFNSARLRDANLADFDYWLRATADLPNVETYKIDNEPFWSTQAYPVFGYDEATVGCAPETFQAAMQAAYPTVADWRRRIDGTLSGRIVPWRDWSEMHLPDGAARGLTFVAFLRQRYGTLAALNEAWGRHYTDWGQVFPPLPVVEQGRKSDDSGAPEFDLGGFHPLKLGQPRRRPEDVVAWRDWTLFWPHNIDDELKEYVALARERHVATPVTTNCVGGSTINNNGDLVVANAMLPWITPDGLDAVAIDFYQPGYLQGYLRAVSAAAHGRPMEIHETGGSDTREECWFMTAFAFAYGSRGTLFWRRDQTIPAPASLGLAEAIDVMDTPDLQRNSVPSTDDVAIVYPLAALYGENARTGTAQATLGAVQGALIMAAREQWQYAFPADRDLAADWDGRTGCLVFPAASWLEERTWTAVQAFVAQGGAVVVPDDFAARDENGRPRSESALKEFKRQARVRVLPADAFRELRQSVRGSERAMDFGLTGASPAWVEAVSRFVAEHAHSRLRYVDGSGRLLRTHVAARISPAALYAFVDPWSPAVNIECTLPVTRAVDLKTGGELAMRSTDHGVVVTVNSPATIVRFERRQTTETP